MTRHLPNAFVQRVVLAAGLAGCVAVIFLGVEDTSSLLLDRPPGAGSWLVATGLVALFVPLVRPWIARVADRVAFGPDGDPYAVMSRFVQQVTDAIAVDDVLPHLAKAATKALHAPRGEARLLLEDGSEWRQTWPPDTPELGGDVSLPLRHDGQDVGRLGVDLESDQMSSADRVILDRLAGPAGLALANVRLTYELRRQLTHEMELADRVWASRRRLLDAAAEQQARFTSAVARHVQSRLDDAGRLIGNGTDVDATTLDQARDAVQRGLEALRELAIGVFPPVLAERGLIAALEMHLQDHHPDVVLLADGMPERCSADIEAAAYFTATALLDDVGERGAATLRLAGEHGSLHLRLGSAAAPAAGTLLLVRDRAEAAGGNLSIDQDSEHEVSVEIPLQSKAGEP